MRRLFSLTVLLSLSWADDLASMLSSKPKLSDSDIANKQEGVYFTGLPLANYNPDRGFGYGARLYMYDNGAKSDTIFAYTPYKSQLFAQFFQTTNGWQYHWLYWDSNYVADLPLRLTLSAIYESNSQAPYFGHTAAVSMGALRDTLGNEYATSKAQIEALGTQGSPYYNRFGFYNPRLEINAQYDLLGGIVRVATGLKLSHVTVKRYESVTTTTNPELVKDNNASLLSASTRGVAGGFNNALKIGIIYDSRDFAPNAKSGSAHDLTAELFTPLLGSTYSYERYTFSTKNFYTLPFYERLTLGGQFVYSAMRGEAPFYDYQSLGYTDDTKSGLGGLRTMRGYMQNRFMGPVKSVVNLEARWRFLQLGANEFVFVPFIDSGAAYDSLMLDVTQFRSTYGAGVRFVWNQSTTIIVDYGTNSEDSGLYIDFNHIF
ncbi:MAG: hypothetical protein KU37_09155 [Sulfuricurvum sp. PC08-66]|nr:MAG: hypothetical protein KU37_09155 [Sulfuricurvum sp. PC08-66]